MKMTKIFAVALAALTIASCSGNEEIGGSDNGGNGEEINAPTYATFKFNIGGASGRAVTDFDPTTSPEQDAADGKIGRLQLLIFNAGTQALEYNGVMAAGEQKKTVLLTAGKKKIFFVANSDKLTDYNKAIDPTDFTVGTKTLTDFYALNFSAGTPQQITKVQTVDRKFDLSGLRTLSRTETNKEAGLPMSNTNEVTYTLTAGVSESDAQGGISTTGGTSATNTFEVQLYYMIAKARLVLAAGVESPVNDLGKPVITNINYSIRNLARATNYIQNVPTANSPQSYYYSSTFANQTAFDKEFDYASNIKVLATTTPSEYLYVPENNHSMLLRGQSSYFAIKANFEPIVISAVVFDVTTTVKYTTMRLISADANLNYIYTTKDVQGIPAGTYFVNVKKFEEAAWIMQNGKPFVEAEHREAAKLLVADPTSTAPTVGGDYMSFTGAKSYYRVDLGEGTGTDTQYGVLRSNKYNATINKITGPGVPSEEDLIVDPTDPVSARTYINATIKAALWKAVVQSADL